MRIEITTGKELHAAIRSAKIILVQPRLGCSEVWVKISKAEAKRLIKDIKDTDTASDLEMGTSMFGDIEGDTIYLG